MTSVNGSESIFCPKRQCKLNPATPHFDTTQYKIFQIPYKESIHQTETKLKSIFEDFSVYRIHIFQIIYSGF